MKKVTLVSIILLFVGTGVMAQQTNIVVAIAKKYTDCVSTDLGYAVYSGTSRTSELGKKAESRVKMENPGYERVESKDNIDWGDYMGNYMVIISASTTDSDGCKRYTLGVGFGTGSDSALKNAKKDLSGRNWSWSESRHGYSVVQEKRF